MKILILTDEIAPPAYAPRINSLVRHLAAAGVETCVFSDRLPGVPPYKGVHGVWYQTAYYGNRQRQAAYLADKLLNRRETLFRHYVEQTTDVRDYDAIFCSTCYYFPLQTAQALSQHYNKPLVVDLRDIAEQWGDVPYMTHKSRMPKWLLSIVQQWFERKNIRRRNEVLTHAQAVITISGWHKRLLSRYNSRTELVYNGFDTTEFYPQDIKTDKFTISYAGKLYDVNFRDPRLMFEAVQKLTSSGMIDAKDVEIVFHIDCPAIPVIQSLARQYNISELCHIGGYIPKQSLYDLLHRSSIALVLTCLSTPTGPHGILGTKFYEALGVEKPVLCVRSDEDALEEVIKLTNAGMAARTVEDASAFILSKYHEWKEKGFTRQQVNQETKLLFSREAESEQILKIIRDAR